MLLAVDYTYIFPYIIKIVIFIRPFIYLFIYLHLLICLFFKRIGYFIFYFHFVLSLLIKLGKGAAYELPLYAVALSSSVLRRSACAGPRYDGIALVPFLWCFEVGGC
jgi:hypothetical protein